VTALQTQPRVLTQRDAGAVRSLVEVDRLVNCVLDARLCRAPDLDPSRLGGLLWGVEDGAQSGLRAAAFHGGNLIPVGTDLQALEMLAAQIARTPRGCSSIVGPAAAVERMWPVLARRWGPARAVRQRQPFLVSDRAAPMTGDASVRSVRPDELRRYLPAAVAMFTEELGVSPIGHDFGAGYRRRVAGLINSGRAFARFDRRGHIEFKAEIGALTRDTAQIQGVWVRPDLRRRGLGTAAMAAVIEHSLRLAPTVSLYVNDYNNAARRLYERLGMTQYGTLSTVLF
jgi:predicted GNAT family acetyltransferase